MPQTVKINPYTRTVDLLGERINRGVPSLERSLLIKQLERLLIYEALWHAKYV